MFRQKHFFYPVIFLLFFVLAPAGARATVDETSKYDMAAEAISLSLPSPAVRQPLTISVRAKNNGQANLFTSNGLGVSYKFDDFYVSKYTGVSPTLENYIPAGGYFYYIFEGWFTVAGAKGLSFTIDPNDQLAETNEANNTLKSSLTAYLPGEADLAASSIVLGKSNVLLGEIFDITFNIKNSGKVSLTNGTGLSEPEVSVTLTNFEKKSGTKDNYPTPASPLNPDGIYKYVYSGAFNQPGVNSVSFRININKDLVESDYNNDITTTTFMVYTSQKELEGFTILSSSVNNISSTSVELLWTTSKSTTLSMFYHQEGFISTEKNVTDTAKTEHKITLSGLKPGAAYDYTATFTNGSFNEYSGLRSFTAPENDNFKTISQTTATTTSNTTTSTSNNTSTVSQANTTAGATVGIAIKNNALFDRLRGRIILKVESRGEAYYLNPADRKMYFLGRPEDAYGVMREKGIGITNANLIKMPVSLSSLSGADADADGLPDSIEVALGTNKNNQDTDGDGHGDKEEIATGYSPTVAGQKLNLDAAFTKTNAGRIFLQVEGRGEAWYVNPGDNKRYFLGRAADAFQIMRQLGIGISNKDFASL